MALAAGCTRQSAPGSGVEPNELDVTAWTEDINYLRTELPSRHPNLFFHLSEAEWNHRLDALIDGLGDTTELQLYVGLQQAVSAVGDAHTDINVPVPQDRYPFHLQSFSDGIFLTYVRPDYAELLGAELLAVNDIAVPELMSRLATIVSNENENWLAEHVQYLCIRAWLEGLGIAKGDTAAFTLRDREGTDREVQLNAIPENQLDFSTWLTIPDRTVERPLYLTGLEDENGRFRSFWYTYLPKGRLFYVQYNRCDANEYPVAGDTGKPFDEWAAEVIHEVGSHPVDRFVVDLRFNTGGDSDVAHSFFDELGSLADVRGQPIAGSGHLFAIVGHQTFSSAMVHVGQLERLGATFVGEPTGGQLAGYGRPASFKLPNSGLVVTCSSSYVATRLEPADYPDRPEGAGPEEPLLPDQLVQSTFEDYASGSDPVLDAIVHWGE